MAKHQDRFSFPAELGRKLRELRLGVAVSAGRFCGSRGSAIATESLSRTSQMMVSPETRMLHTLTLVGEPVRRRLLGTVVSLKAVRFQLPGSRRLIPD